MEEREVRATRIRGPIKVDGILEESSWQSQGFTGFTQFEVNPSGSIRDGTLFNDEGKDYIWDGVWSYAAHRDKKGWSVEIKIPYNQLRFKKKEQYVWGVNFIRIIKRKNEKSFFSWVSKEESGYVSRFAVLRGIKDIKPARLFDLMPFAVGKASIKPEEPGNPFQTGGEWAGNAGFDLKAGLRSNLTLNMTVNPDFGQVEVDPAVINISDQETYYEEKRPFFIEGADIFRFGTGGANTVRYIGWDNPSFFYSRRIGRSPQGYVQPYGYVDYPAWTTILTAAKVTGKIGRGWNIGFLGALTNRENATREVNGERSKQEIEPLFYYGVLRAQKEFNQGNQGLGFIATPVLRNFQTDKLAEMIPKNAFTFAVDGWSFLDKDKTWVLTGWFGGTNVSGTKEAITLLQLSPLHYFQRPDVDYVHVSRDATSLGGWGGPIAEYPWGFTRSLSIQSDNRKKIIGSLSAHYRTHPYGAYNWSLYGGLKWKPRSNLSLSINPGFMWRHSVGQWVTRVEDELKTETYGVRYVMSDIIVETIPIEIRVNWTFTPQLSLQAYLQPYIGVGDYFDFKEWKKPRTFDFDIYGEGDSTISLEEGVYTFDPDGSGPAEPFSVRNPDFNLKSMRGTVVLRWEYNPGSTFFAVQSSR